MPAITTHLEHILLFPRYEKYTKDGLTVFQACFKTIFGYTYVH